MERASPDNQMSFLRGNLRLPIRAQQTYSTTTYYALKTLTMMPLQNTAQIDVTAFEKSNDWTEALEKRFQIIKTGMVYVSQ